MSGTTFTFTNAAGADWNTVGNWNQGTTVAATVPNGPTDVALITANEPFIYDATDTVAQVVVSGDGHLIVGGSPAIGTPGTAGGTLTVSGTIIATSTNTGGALVGGLGGVFTADEMDFGPGALIGGGGTFVANTMINNGVILADGALYDLGPLLLGGNTITGSGSLEIQGSSILDLGMATSQNLNVNTAGTDHPILLLSNPAGYTGTIGMANADTSLEVVLGGTVGHLMGLINGGNTLGIDSNAIALTRGDANTFALTGGAGNDTIFGAGAGTISGGAGTNTLIAQSATTTVNSSGTGDTVIIAAGAATVTSSGDNTGILMSGTGAVTANLTGNGDTVFASSASSATVTTAHDALVFGGAGTLNFVVGDGAATVVGGAGSAANTDSTTQVQGGAGETTVFGSAGSNTTFTSTDGHAIMLAGAGNETLNAAGTSAGNVFASNGDAASNTTWVGGNGDDAMFVGAGAFSMTGGAGADAYVFYKSATAGMHDFITDFSDGDGVYLSGYDPSQSASSLVNNAEVSGSGVTITLSDSTQITFSNLTQASQLNGKILYG